MSAALHHVRLELAREPGHPHGSADVGYDLVLPLDADLRIDAEACRADAGRWRVRRFRQGQTDKVGQLKETAPGAWIFDFEPGEADDEAGFRLSEEQFTPGEYVSISTPAGLQRTFRVVACQPLPPRG